MEMLTMVLIAHESKKEDMISLIKAHLDELSHVNLVALKEVGEAVQSKTGLPLTLLESGLHGGGQQVEYLVANQGVAAVIFLRDPLIIQPHEPKITDLLRVCDMHGVPLATNLAAGEAIIHLIAEHPEALGGHHLISQYLEDIAAVHE